MADEQKQPQGWRDVQLNVNMPLNSLVDFFNVLNQRICNIEDNTVITVDEQGTGMSLTELYAFQAKQQEIANQQAQQVQQAAPTETIQPEVVTGDNSQTASEQYIAGEVADPKN